MLLFFRRISCVTNPSRFALALSDAHNMMPLDAAARAPLFFFRVVY